MLSYKETHKSIVPVHFVPAWHWNINENQNRSWYVLPVTNNLSNRLEIGGPYCRYPVHHCDLSLGDRDLGLFSNVDFFFL